MKYLSKLKLTQKTLVLMSIGLMTQLANADVIHNDDVIVEGSQCISDSSLCANGESFVPPDNVSSTDLKVKDGVPNIWFQDTDAGDTDWTINIDNDNVAAGGGGAESFGIWNQESNTTSFIIENGVSTRGMLTIDAGERIGVGTTTPGETLEIASTQPGFRLNDTNAGQADIEVTGDFLVMQNTANTKVVNMEINGGVTQANQLYFDSDGDIGIQVANPLRDLEVGGDSTIRLVDEQQSWDLGGTDDFVFNMIQGGVTKSIMTFENDDSPCTGAGGTEVAPCVGFFEASNPDASVHIKKSDGTTTLLVEEGSAITAVRNVLKLRNNGGVGFQLEDSSNTNKWEFRTGGSGAFLISDVNVGGAKMLMNSTGLVNMGKNVAAGSNAWNFELDADGDLHIAGNMYVSGTQLSVPDYVFADDYKLMPLDELQSFVQKEKHLPNVASESEIKKAKSINVGESQMRHLEKIEELTLYTLQQHQQIKRQQEQIEALRLSVAENTKMTERLASLEKLVTNLAFSNEHLSLSGETVATVK